MKSVFDRLGVVAYKKRLFLFIIPDKVVG